MAAAKIEFGWSDFRFLLLISSLITPALLYLVYFFTLRKPKKKLMELIFGKTKCPATCFVYDVF
jgi:hypothetical protein